MFGRTLLVAVLALAALVSFTRAARAGGWALVKLDATPESVRAGEKVHLGFMVLQHGQTPVHYIGDGRSSSPISAYLSAQNVRSGESIRAEAVRDAPVGHFVVDVTFPSAGRWLWSITPEPFAGTSLGELKVTPPLGASDEANAAPPQQAQHLQASALDTRRTAVSAGVGAVALAVLAGVGFAVWRRRAKAV